MVEGRSLLPHRPVYRSQMTLRAAASQASTVRNTETCSTRRVAYHVTSDIVRDANNFAVAYVYFENEPGRRAAANLMSKDGLQMPGAPKAAAGLNACVADMKKPRHQLLPQGVGSEARRGFQFRR